MSIPGPPLTQPGTDWLSAGLSAEQARPLQSTSANTLILAAAGSGKTRTLVQLVLQELDRCRAPERIVAFTFTDKAAEELRTRVAMAAQQQLPGLDLAGMYVGTIHGWALQYLLDRPTFYGFESIDSLQLRTLVTRLAPDLNLGRIYGGAAQSDAIDRFLADLEVIDNDGIALTSVPQPLRTAVQETREIMNRERLLTFGGQIREATAQLGEAPPPAVLHLFIDEYQDVNPAQVALVRAMMGDATRLTVVGDDFQGIYGWRGADVHRILHFGDDFPDPETFLLSENYRSRPHILAVANAISDRLPQGPHPKAISPVRPETAGPAAAWLAIEEPLHDSVDAVVGIVQGFLADGVPPESIAVLLRSVKLLGRPLQQRLTEAGIPVNAPRLGRGGEFIEDFLVPVLHFLQGAFTSRDPGTREERMATLWTVAAPWVGAEAEERFWSGLRGWYRALNSGDEDRYNLMGQLLTFLDACGIGVRIDDDELVVSIGIATQIIFGVESMARRRVTGIERPSPLEITRLALVALRGQAASRESMPISRSASGVVIGSVHSAKGLEWPVVIVPGINRNSFPILRDRPPITALPRDMVARYQTTIEDEARLLYVATTRARDRLVFLSSDRDNQREASQLGPWLEGTLDRVGSLGDLPRDFTQLDPKDAHAEPDPVLRFGLSDLLLYEACPLQYGLRRVAGVQPPVANDLGFGHGLHEVIQRRIQGGGAWDWATTEAQVREHVHLPLVEADIEERARQAIARQVALLETIQMFALPGESEVRVEQEVAGAQVHGTVDTIHRLDDDTMLIRDWKAGLAEEMMGRYHLQLQFYASALQRQGLPVRRAEIVDVGKTTRRGVPMTTEVELSAVATEQALERLERSVRGVAEGKFDPRPSPLTCDGCDLRPICKHRATSNV